MATDVNAILTAARMPSDVPEVKFGLWSFWRRAVTNPIQRYVVGGDVHAILGRVSYLTLNQPDHYEIVMEDSLPELRRHAPIFRHGHGRVLVSGLGMGCVVRGLLTKPEVEHIDVVEIERRIIEHFGAEFAGNPRVSLHHGDALTYPWPDDARWDVAWHDIHCIKEDSLVLLHASLVKRFYHQCTKQGWWGAGARIARRAAPGHILAA